MGNNDNEHNKMNEKTLKMEWKCKAFDGLMATVEHLKTVNEKLEQTSTLKINGQGGLTSKSAEFLKKRR